MLSIIKYLSNGGLLKVSNDNPDVSESGCSSGPSAPSASDSELGVADLAVLEPLTEEAVLDNLYTRFKRDMIYVSSPRDIESLYQPILSTPRNITSYYQLRNIESCYQPMSSTHRNRVMLSTCRPLSRPSW